MHAGAGVKGLGNGTAACREGHELLPLVRGEASVGSPGHRRGPALPPMLQLFSQVLPTEIIVAKFAVSAAWLLINSNPPLVNEPAFTVKVATAVVAVPPSC